MANRKFSFSGSFQKGKEYIKTQAEILKLQAIAKASGIIGRLIIQSIKVMLMLFIAFYLSMALGFYFGNLLGSYALGFLLIGVIFIGLFFLVVALRKPIKALFVNRVIKIIFEDDEDDDEEEEKGNPQPVNNTTDFKGNINSEINEPQYN